MLMEQYVDQRKDEPTDGSKQKQVIKMGSYYTCHFKEKLLSVFSLKLMKEK